MSTPRMWSWNRSPFAAKARIAFAEKGVGVDLIEVSGNPVKRPPRLRELNPTGRVPVLEVDDCAISESTAICEWLEDTHSRPALWPERPASRAVARGLLRWVDDQLTAPFFFAMRKQAYGLDPDDPPEIVAKLRERLVGNWPVIEDLLGRTDGPWLNDGDDPLLPDLAAIPLAVRLPQWTPELVPSPERHPRTTAWLERLRGRPSAVEVDRKGQPFNTLSSERP